MSAPSDEALEALARAEEQQRQRAYVPQGDEADELQRCPRCHDLIGGGPEGWRRHAAGLDSAEVLLEASHEEARLEHARQASTSYLGRIVHGAF